MVHSVVGFDFWLSFAVCFISFRLWWCVAFGLDGVGSF